MSFFNNFVQNVSKTVTNINNKRFPFGSGGNNETASVSQAAGTANEETCDVSVASQSATSETPHQSSRDPHANVGFPQYSTGSPRQSVTGISRLPGSQHQASASMIGRSMSPCQSSGSLHGIPPTGTRQSSGSLRGIPPTTSRQSSGSLQGISSSTPRSSCGSQSTSLTQRQSSASLHSRSSSSRLSSGSLLGITEMQRQSSGSLNVASAPRRQSVNVTKDTSLKHAPLPAHQHLPPSRVDQPKSQAARSNRTKTIVESGVAKPSSEESDSKTRRYKQDLPFTASSSRVEEGDGKFFEQFAALPAKQQKRLSKQKRHLLAKAETSESPDLSSIDIAVKTAPITQQEQEKLYLEVLYTIQHKVGSTAAHHSEFVDELNTYAQQAFHFSSEQHKRIQALASEEKPPIVILNLVVVEAEGLEAKDPNGFSDPYCMLGIVTASDKSRQSPSPTSLTGYATMTSPNQSRDSRASLPENTLDTNPAQFQPEKLRKHHSFRLSFKRKSDCKLAGHLAVNSSLQPSVTSPSQSTSSAFAPHFDSVTQMEVPAKFIRVTTVRPNTLNPKWHEKFRLDTEDASTDYLHLDIWDHDDETSVLDAVRKLNEVKGVRGMARFFKQVAQSARSGSQDDFLGCINVKLQDIPSTGLDRWFVLEGRTARSAVQGRIRLKMTLSTREDRGVSEEDLWSEIVQQEKLTEIFVRHELTKYSGAVSEWDGQLSTDANTILHQHALQGDLNNLQQQVCRWRGLCSYHLGVRPLSYSLMKYLISELDSNIDDDSLTYEEQESLAEVFRQFIEHSLHVLRRLYKLFPFGSKPAMEKLKSLLSCLSQLDRSSLFRRVLPFHREIKDDVCYSVKKAAVQWYTSQINRSKIAPNHEEDQCVSTSCLIEALYQVTALCSHAYNHMDPVFKQSMSVPFFQLTYKKFDKLVMSDVTSVVQRLCSELNIPQVDSESTTSVTMAISMFELYLLLHAFTSLAGKLQTNERLHLETTNYQNLFAPAFSRWLDIARFKVMWRVGQAVELDQIIDNDKLVRHCSSTLDVVFCFNQLRCFWNSLHWPVTGDTEGLNSKLLEIVVSATQYYTELITRKISPIELPSGGCTVPPKVCAYMNNIEHARRFVINMQDDLMLQCKESGFDTNTQSGSSGSVVSLAKEVTSDMDSKIRDISKRIVDMMTGDLRRHVFHLAWSPETLPAEEAICPLMDYLDGCLICLHSDLMKVNFERVLAEIWRNTLLEINGQASSQTDEKSEQFFGRLLAALEILSAFFNAEGGGLTHQQLNTELFQEINQNFQLRRSSTEDLVNQFHALRVSHQLQLQQAEVPAVYGSLFVRAFYRHDSLTVEVLSARNLIPLDHNGLSDPFVIIEVLPRSIFSLCRIQQTAIHKRTLNPTFDECFEYCVTREQCRDENSVILFTVMDHDVLTHNDYGGESYLSLNGIPGVCDRSEKADSFHGLKEIELKLMQPSDKDDPILHVLEERTNDQAAQSLIRQRRERITKTS